MKIYSILILSSGSKILLVKSFLKVLSSYNGISLLTSDILADCSSSQFSDQHIVLPSSSSASFKSCYR